MIYGLRFSENLIRIESKQISFSYYSIWYELKNI